MKNTKINGDLNELNNFFQLFLPDFNTFKELVKDMAKISSPYQSDLHHIRIMINTEKQIKNSPDIQKIVTLIIKELNEFSVVLNKISNDEDDVKQLYSNEGLLDKSVNLQKNMVEKLGLAMQS